MRNALLFGTAVLIACGQQPAADPPDAAAANHDQALTITIGPGAQSACDSAAARWAGRARASVLRGDTLLTSVDVLRDIVADSAVASSDSVHYAACYVVGTQPEGLDPTHLYWTEARWPLVFRLTADGPDGQVRTFQRGSTRCQVSNEWDGGDDSDSTYVPDPFYRERTFCWSHPRSLEPEDTAQAM